MAPDWINTTWSVPSRKEISAMKEGSFDHNLENGWDAGQHGGNHPQRQHSRYDLECLEGWYHKSWEGGVTLPREDTRSGIHLLVQSNNGQSWERGTAKKTDAKEACAIYEPTDRIPLTAWRAIISLSSDILRVCSTLRLEHVLVPFHQYFFLLL
ncbi:hypothetical protein B0H19DRAFT_1233867 [Mycena capillaripes]|nr:hypothetical protein B0H19DRAFT_1233867 [Mycena capillaripes]